ncbi:thiol peroxidase [Corynebacterium caspium]|uniref:thiol peroxidase n=1 Tax=Corynebacterium caspium TaxID=234828 RepID=UPI0003617F10|nr:thiol peroxidase [Corynebacterium caspium]WKD59185.1 putative thiol peroxidase [Corynebacterium caspium DSM 44850]
MATTHLQGTPVRTSGELPAVGEKLPEIHLVGQDFQNFSTADLAGQRIVLNIFPSIDTGVCAMSVRHFNQDAADLENTVVVCASADLPPALARFCGAEGIENLRMGSSFRTDFGQNFGVTLEESPLQGLLARAVIVADVDGTVLHTELVPEISTEPNYEAALQALAS